MSTPAVSFAVNRPPCDCLSLASVRERQGMTLDEIAQATRIGSYYLQAIEAEEFGNLPGGVYNTSYIRQYARAIGYSEAALLDRYFALSGAVPISLEEAQTAAAPKRSGGAMALFLGHLSAK